MAAAASPSIEIRPRRGALDATVTVPGSKSLTNRALVIGALADGETRLRGALDSDDTRALDGALRALGFGVEWDRPAAMIRVAGRGGRIPASAAELHGGNAGTAVRFLVSLVALGRGRFRIDGDRRMRERPIGDLLRALAALGVAAWSERGNDCPPVVVAADGVRGGRSTVDGAASSQFASSILLAAPYAASDVELAVRGDLVGAPFVAMTLELMRRRGVESERDGSTIRVRAGQRYAAGEVAIEPDATAASYFMAAAALLGGRVTVADLPLDSLQGDLAFADVLREMGARVRHGVDGITVEGVGELRGVDRDFRDISDTFLTAAAMAPFASSPTRIRGIRHTRAQESDRVSAVAAELARLGVRVVESDDGLEIFPSPPHGGAVETHGDHRIAMSFALIGLRVPGIRIVDPGCVAKTFPDYFERLEALA